MTVRPSRLLRVALLCIVCSALLNGAAHDRALLLRARAQPSGRAVQNERIARLIARGEVLREAGDTISALSYFRDAISAAPRRSEGYVALGQLYLQLEEPVRALEVFEAGTRAADRSEALWLGLAAALSALGQNERALSALRQLRTLSPSPLGLRALASAAEARGAFVEALSARRALVEALLQSDASEDQQRELSAQRAQVRALELILGAADRVRGRGACEPEGVSAVLRALAHCP